MNPIKTTLNDEQQQITVDAMQASLAEMIDLTLAAKQAHWNVVGPGFRPLHLQLDEMTAQYRDWADQLAERRTSLGAPADGRATTVASKADLPVMEAGWLNQGRVIDSMTERLHTVISRYRHRVEALDKVDLVSQDLLIGIVAGLEQQSWMLQAQRS